MSIESAILVVGMLSAFVLGTCFGEYWFKKYLQLKAESNGSKSFKMFGEWYMIDKESRG